MAKEKKPFVLIDESVLHYGFRVLMSGYKPGLFESNPVMLFMHSRAQAGVFSGPVTNEVVLPIGKWNNIRVDGTRLMADPEFDMDDEVAKKISNKVDKGYLNAASVSLIPIAVSDDPALKLQGQPGPTVTEWEIAESSVVDIPNCRNALTIRNSAGGYIQCSADGDNRDALQLLNSLIPEKNNNMELKDIAVKLGLPVTATQAEVDAKLVSLSGLVSQNAELLTAKNTAEEKVRQLELAAQTGKVEKLVDDAIAGKKILEGDRDKYLKLAKADFDTTKEILDAAKPYASIEAGLTSNGNTGANSVELGQLISLSGIELYRQGKFERLKELSQPHYELKYKEFLDFAK